MSSWSRKNRSAIAGSRGKDLRDEEVAVLRISDSEYQQLLQRTDAGLLHPTWADYCHWTEQLMQQGIDRGWSLHVIDGSAQGVCAFIYHGKGVELHPGALCAYAVHLLRVQQGKGV